MRGSKKDGWGRRGVEQEVGERYSARTETANEGNRFKRPPIIIPPAAVAPSTFTVLTMLEIVRTSRDGPSPCERRSRSLLKHVYQAV